jgi:hypothetical protein
MAQLYLAAVHAVNGAPPPTTPVEVTPSLDEPGTVIESSTDADTAPGDWNLAYARSCK